MANRKSLEASRRFQIGKRERCAKPWRDAINELRSQLMSECLARPPERRRFQNGRLMSNFMAKTLDTPNAICACLESYWLFCGSPWQVKTGYDSARQQHYGELRVCGLSPEIQTTNDIKSLVDDLSFRLDSLASWLEAEEAWIFWRGVRDLPAIVDRNDQIAREQAIGSSLVSKLPDLTNIFSDRAIADIVRRMRHWTKSQWSKILKTAARLAIEPDKPPSPLEAWVWWRFPIFLRYRWSAAEACRAALEKFPEIEELQNEEAFQLSWIRRGLRFSGKRRRRRQPPLWDFVISEPLPKILPTEYSLLA